MQQLFFFDIDGTLAHRGHIPPENKNALNALRAQGHLTFLCTGRPVCYARRLFGDLVDGFITNNGRYGALGPRVMFSRPFSVDELRHYQQAFKCIGCGYAFLGSDQGYIGGVPAEQVDPLSLRYGWEGFFTPQWSIDDIQAYSFDVFYQNNAQYVALRRLLDHEVIFNDHHGAFSADCTTRVFDKGDGIAAMKQALSLPRTRSFAFGDGSNDVCMFRSVDVRVAMGNAVPALQQVADYVTNSYDRGGIAHALQHFHML